MIYRNYFTIIKKVVSAKKPKAEVKKETYSDEAAVQ